MDSIDIVRKQVWDSAYVRRHIEMVRRHYLLVMVVVLPMLSTLLASWSVNSILIARGFLQLR